MQRNIDPLCRILIADNIAARFSFRMYTASSHPWNTDDATNACLICTQPSSIQQPQGCSIKVFSLSAILCRFNIHYARHQTRLLGALGCVPNLAEMQHVAASFLMPLHYCRPCAKCWLSITLAPPPNHILRRSLFVLLGIHVIYPAKQRRAQHYPNLQHLQDCMRSAEGSLTDNQLTDSHRELTEAWQT